MPYDPAPMFDCDEATGATGLRQVSRGSGVVCVVAACLALELAVCGGCASSTGLPDVQQADVFLDQVTEAASHAVTCAGVACPDGQQCCFLTGACFEPSMAAEQCPAPVGSDDAGQPCGSDQDCQTGELCRALTCLGAGVCQSLADTECMGEYCFEQDCRVCGCDGQTYILSVLRLALAAGVRVAGPISMRDRARSGCGGVRCRSRM